MKTSAKIPRINPNQHAKNRVQAIKGLLPRSWRQLIFDRHKEYDCAEGYNLLNNVFYLKVADLRVTEIFESLVKSTNGKDD